MTIKSLIDFRLRSQKIGGKPVGIHETVSYMGAMQAQDYYGALWSIGLRTRKTEKQVIEAVEKAEIVRTWPQRGTLHYVAAEDARWMVNLSATKLIAGVKRRHEDLGLNVSILERSKELFAAALSGGKRLTRPQMMDVLEEASISIKTGRGYHMLWNAAQTGLIYMGPMEGKQQTFGLLVDLNCKHKEMSREESIVELTKCYFISHGPATIQDFVGWAGLTVAETKMGLEANKSHLISDNFDGKDYCLAGDLPKSTKIPETLLLPGFDEYILGYKDRSAQVEADYFNRLIPGGNGMFMSSIVIRGRVVGLWRRVLKKDRVVVTPVPFEVFSAKDIDSVEEAAQKYGKFLGVSAEMAWPK